MSSLAPLKSLANGHAVSEQVPLSIYVIADFDTEDGLNTLRAALAFSVRRVYIPPYSSNLATQRIPLLHNHA